MAVITFVTINNILIIPIAYRIVINKLDILRYPKIHMNKLYTIHFCPQVPRSTAQHPEPIYATPSSFDRCLQLQSMM